MPKAPVKLDGRHARGHATRDVILAAARRLIEKTGKVPTQAQVAKEAKVALRTIYHHFGDAETVVAHALALEPQRDLVITYHPFGWKKPRKVAATTTKRVAKKKAAA